MTEQPNLRAGHPSHRSRRGAAVAASAVLTMARVQAVSMTLNLSFDRLAEFAREIRVQPWIAWNCC
jgi:hypothetical protein